THIVTRKKKRRYGSASGRWLKALNASDQTHAVPRTLDAAKRRDNLYALQRSVASHSPLFAAPHPAR
ncbi:hypothetical protein JTM10_38330, partial [Pseudomonas aeruginosa]|nr:hypothetical protein [Pseudomonas aeruginosa]